MVNRPVASFYTLGCKLNQAETELLAWQFAKAGYRIANRGGADVCILNTCTVTHIADRKSRHLLRLLRKKNSNALIVATGCYAERSPHELAEIGVDLVVGNKQKMNLLRLVRGISDFQTAVAVEECAVAGIGRVRSFLRIQDGCNDHCAYCIVPMMRGREFCLPADEIISQINFRVAAGYKEVILTGTKIGTYKSNGINFQNLINLILKETDIQRLHLSSLQPQETNHAAPAAAL